MNINWLPPAVVAASERLAKAIDLPDLSGSTVWLAVTGLSRSGKTVFTTSLIHNLLSAVHNPNRMPLLNVVGERRLIAAPGERPRATAAALSLSAEHRDHGVRRAGLAGAHRRHQRDRHRHAFLAGGQLGKLLSEISGSAATLTIRIVDYPGEWLLDLPLLDQSFAEWSRATLRAYRKGVRAELARDFLAFIAEHPPERNRQRAGGAAGPRSLSRGAGQGARQYGLSFLQPGRFLCRGSLGDVPYLWFSPLDVAEGVDTFAPHTLGALMAERFEVYKREVVARFYEEHFRHYRRQIVLVDVLRALLAGRDAFEDTRLALDRDPAQLPLWPRRADVAAARRPAHRQGAVRRHQGRSRAGRSARPSGGAAAEHGGAFRRST